VRRPIPADASGLFKAALQRIDQLSKVRDEPGNVEDWGSVWR